MLTDARVARHRISEPAADVLRWPLLGSFLKWRHSRTFLQVPLLVLSIVMILHGLFGPSLSPKNLATNLSWVQFRGLLVLVLLCAGNFFCTACPFVLARDLARRLHAPRLNWPRRLRNKWLSLALFAGILFIYEAFSLWSKPQWTAWVVVGYFAAILVVDSTFKHATFCKFLCPIGQFNFLSSTLSPLEVKVREQDVCGACGTKDCIRGTRSPQSELVTIQRGCELALFLPAKVGNLDCTFCLDCVHACPHDNIGIQARTPGEELTNDPLRSGIGYLSKRRDLAALAALFTFGALMNAFGMVSPIYALERWLGTLLHIRTQAVIVGLVFSSGLFLEPAILLGAAAALTRRFAYVKRGLPEILVRYSYSLAPVGFGMWLAHYGFHLFTGLFTIVPVAQNAVLDISGEAILGTPRWTWVGLPLRVVQPIEFGFLLLGCAGSLSLLYQLAEEDCGQRWVRAFLPWASVCLLLVVAGFWLMTQPMDMRATFLE